MSTNCTNTPMDEGLDISIDYSPLLVVRGNSDTLAQLCFNYYGAGIVVRETNNIGNGLEPHWQPWKKLVFQTNLDSFSISAINISYDNSTTGLNANNLQEAIDLLRYDFETTLYEHKTQTGSFSYSVYDVWGETYTKTIIFPTPYAKIPTVTASCGIGYGVKVRDITETSCIIDWTYGGGNDGKHTITWTAQGYVSKV